MLKTQITGAKYLSPQTNQMTNLNIAVPADSKDTNFSSSDILLAKDVAAYYYTKEETDNLILIAKNSAINMHNEDNTKSIKLDINDTEAEGEYESTVNVCLTDLNYECNANINAFDGFRHTDSSGSFGSLCSNGLYISDGTNSTYIHNDGVSMTVNDSNDNFVMIGKFNNKYNLILLGDDSKFKISRPLDNTEGATITGVKSLTAFANPSATKVWATDGSTVDLTTKANTSDVLLKKSASGGYYIEENSNELGLGAFATSSLCTASGMFAYAEGAATASGMVAHAECDATASGDSSHAECGATASGANSHAEGSSNAVGDSSHAEGGLTKAIGEASHAEGNYTEASGAYSHAEGVVTLASGYCSHALGTHNVDDKNAIHSVGIGNSTTRKNAEYIYAKNNKSGYSLTDDPKNGYKYLIGVGGYDGISTDNTTYKSVQEVIADLTARIEQLETKIRALEAANTPA